MNKSYISAASSVGGIIASGANASTVIKNCLVIDTYVGQTTTTIANLLGKFDDGTYKALTSDLYYTLAINHPGNGGHLTQSAIQIGGICGDCFNNEVTIINCAFLATTNTSNATLCAEWSINDMPGMDIRN